METWNLFRFIIRNNIFFFYHIILSYCTVIDHGRYQNEARKKWHTRHQTFSVIYYRTGPLTTCNLIVLFDEKGKFY